MTLRLLLTLLLNSNYLSAGSLRTGSWAYIFYILIPASFAVGVLNWHSKNLKKKRIALEELVKSQKEKLAEFTSLEKRSQNQVLKLEAELEVYKNELLATKQCLQKAQHQLVESEKMASLGQLTAGIAHEINNPINFISGGVQALEILQNEIFGCQEPTAEPLSSAKEDLKELMKSINNGVSRTATIIKSLKTFSSPIDTIDTEGRMDVKECTENALILVGSKFIENSIIVKKNFTHRSGAKGNSSQISQVLINILDNSIYALLKTSQEKILNINTHETEEDVVIKIKDNGTGIPSQAQCHVFEPFFTTKEVGSGTGLGLSICYSIIEKHNGKISFVSSEGMGTEFTIMLPKGEPIQIW
jgi:C4-dicarboxylate-specific signal transduction histidine kinase